MPIINDFLTEYCVGSDGPHSLNNILQIIL